MAIFIGGYLIMNFEKNDIKGREWIIQPFRHSVPKGSFMFPKPIRAPRDLTWTCGIFALRSDVNLIGLWAAERGE